MSETDLSRLQAMVRDDLIPADEAFTAAMVAAEHARERCVAARSRILETPEAKSLDAMLRLGARLSINEFRRAIPPGIRAATGHAGARDGLSLADVHRQILILDLHRPACGQL